MDNYIDSLGKAEVFTASDALWRYWQVPTIDGNKDMTTLTSYYYAYCQICMRFGLQNAPATFQPELNIILSVLQWATCFGHIDDDFIFSKDKRPHGKAINEMPTLLPQAEITLILKNCNFLQNKIGHLGHLFESCPVSTDSKYFDTIKTPVNHTDWTQMRSFLRACYVCRRFRKYFSRIAEQLNDYLRKYKDLDWFDRTAGAPQFYETLITEFLLPPVLALSQPHIRNMIDTDASAYVLIAFPLKHQKDINLNKCSMNGN